jgi:hypothetical protein
MRGGSRSVVSADFSQSIRYPGPVLAQRQPDQFLEIALVHCPYKPVRQELKETLDRERTNITRNAERLGEGDVPLNVMARQLDVEMPVGRKRPMTPPASSASRASKRA